MAIKVLEYKGASLRLSYEIINPEAGKDILFLHGWGSSKVLMKSVFSKHLKEYRHIYLDLPGFGKSSIEDAMNSSEYAEVVRLFMDALQAQSQCVCGHSFGGKIALLLEPQTLVLMGASGILVPKPLNVRVKIKIFKLLKFFGLQRFKDAFVSKDVEGMSDVMYATFKQVVNEDMHTFFAASKAHTLLLWGEEDTATPLWTAQKMQTLLKDASLEIFPGDHYFFMKQSKRVAESIERFMEAS